MANTLSAASTGVQPCPPRKTLCHRGPRPGRGLPPGSLASRNATILHVTPAAAPGDPCSISASCLSSVSRGHTPVMSSASPARLEPGQRLSTRAPSRADERPSRPRSALRSDRRNSEAPHARCLGGSRSSARISACWRRSARRRPVRPQLGHRPVATRRSAPPPPAQERCDHDLPDVEFRRVLRSATPSARPRRGRSAGSSRSASRRVSSQPDRSSALDRASTEIPRNPSGSDGDHPTGSTSRSQCPAHSRNPPATR